MKVVAFHDGCCLADETNMSLLFAQVVYQMTGLTGFFSGLSARVLYQAPATAISWSVYEFFKYYMKLNSVNSDDNKYDSVDTIGSSSGSAGNPDTSTN